MEKRALWLLLLFGEAGKSFEYRRSFDEPTVFRGVKALTKFRSPRLVWRKDAQVLEVSGVFPDRSNIPDTGGELKKEKNTPQKSTEDECENKVPKEVSDKLTVKEKKFLRAPFSSVVIIRLETLK